MGKLLRFLETVANITIILAGITLLTVNLSSRPGSQDPATRRPYQIGDRLAETHDLRFGRPTFLLFTASSCRFCTESMPLYKEMQAAGASIVFMTNEELADNENFLKEHGIDPDVVLSATENDIDFTHSPSLLYVDSQGVVQGTWWGKQADRGRQEILGRIR